MQLLLIIAIVVLSIAICAVAGFWYVRDRRASRQNAPPPVIVRRQYRNAAWDAAVRAARNRNRI